MQKIGKKTDILAKVAEKKYEIFSVPSYNVTVGNMDRSKYVSTSVEKIIQKISTIDNFYHFRIHNGTTYVFFGDLDHYPHDIIAFKTLLNTFLCKYYGISFTDDEFKYTINNKTNGSFHYSIPKWNATSKKIKEILEKFVKYYEVDLIYTTDKGIKKSCVDTSIYSEHWFRCPNQSKGKTKKTTTIENNQHIIKNGDILDFIIDFIPETSVNIEKIKLINDDAIIKKEFNNKTIASLEIKKYDDSENSIIEYNPNKETILSSVLSQSDLYKKMFDECYKQHRFDGYHCWTVVCMAIKNIFVDEEEAFKLFNYYSSKGSNYDGFEKTRNKFNTFIKKTDGYNNATIYYYAIEDNKPKFIEIMSKNTFELEQTDMCKYLKIIAGNKFIYKKNGEKYILYCYNGCYWQNDDILLRHCISTELYDFLKNILTEVYWDNKQFSSLKQKIQRLKTMSYKKEIVETYKEYGVNNKINFDNKWWLFGFSNKVYDMEEECIREYRYDDYVSITCDYDWREPTQEEIDTVNKLLELIMPVEEERNAYLQILSTGIDGRCLEKIIIFNGSGGNGK
jgi:hypothetical protein